MKNNYPMCIGTVSPAMNCLTDYAIAPLKGSSVYLTLLILGRTAKLKYSTIKSMNLLKAEAISLHAHRFSAKYTPAVMC